ncbi:hypothetical protein OQA88_1594 [Cercophora sp. LCS_1]
MPHPSSFPPIPLPQTDIFSLIFSRPDHQLPFSPSKEILTCASTGASHTWRSIRDKSIAFGRGLQTLYSWNKGDVLALYTPNSIDTPIITLGTLWAGGVISPANPLYTLDELAFQLKDSGARVLVTHAAGEKLAAEAAARAGLGGNVLVIGRGVEGVISSGVHTTSTKAPITPEQDLAFLVYSSGTTGLPKGVMLTHANMIANMLQCAYVEGSQWLPVGGEDGLGDKQLGVLPFFHIYGLACCVLLSVYSGWQLVVMERFDMVRMLEAIQRFRITFVYVPPPVVLAFSKHEAVDRYDLSSLKVLHSGAAPLTRELTEKVWERLKVPVKQGFGLSETSPVTHCQTVPEWARFMGSVGKLFPNMEARIVDEEGGDVGDGEAGELWVKGPNVFVGYLNNPERTRAAFSEDGYFKTGDVFRRDKHGNYYCVDRLKELIKYKGFPVPPAELEGVLVGHAEVTDACVIGVEDETQATEVPRAYVVLRQSVVASEAKAQELADWLAKQVAPHKKLRGGIRFVEQIPKSASGKILRRLVRDQAKKETNSPKAKL